jgi:hypothetical protein
MEKIVSVATALVAVAMVTVLVTNANTSSVITATGNAFASSVRAAMGRG